MFKSLKILILALVLGLQASASADSTKGYIVVFKDSVKSVPDQANEMARRHAFKIDRSYEHAVKGFASKMPDAVVAKLKVDPNVAYVELDVEMKEDSCTTDPVQKVPVSTTRVGGGTTASQFTAWVIDSGIDLTHCDLNIDLARSKNFVPLETSPQDKRGHGTHVAGIIGAKNNGIDTVGVAPGTLLVAVRVLNSTGSGSASWILAGVDYVAANAVPGDVANMSLGYAGHIQSLHDGILKAANKGIKFVISAGNSSALASGWEPAHIEHVNVFTISAVDSKDVFASFSNRGNPPVDWAAPGVSILSSKMGGGTIYMSGTSMAAPHVTGLLLLGPLVKSGSAINDPDGTPDPIAHH